MPKVALRTISDLMPEEGVEQAGSKAYRDRGWRASNPYPYLCEDWRRWQDGHDSAEAQDLMTSFDQFYEEFGEEDALGIANRMAAEAQQL